MTVARETVDGSRREDDSEAASGVEEPRAGLLARIVLLPILAYRRLISPLLGARCRYYPSCSAYAEQAVRELGAGRGTILAVWRVLRCNPMSSGGLDPLDNRRLFRSAHSHDTSCEHEAAT